AEQDIQDTLEFSAEVLAARYAALAPQGRVSLITIGCPQASVGELRAVAELLKGKQVRSAPAGSPDDTPPLWVFTSARNREIAERTGIAQIITASGALLLADTCPEVVPYDPSWVKQVLTNSMKAEHYIKSGLNGIPTAVMRLADCIAIATGERRLSGDPVALARGKAKGGKVGGDRPVRPPATGPFSATGHGLPSQADFVVRGTAFVTDTPITLLGFVNRETGEIEEPGHPAHGQSMAGKIAIFPKGSGSTVAPYVLLELIYRGKAPLAIVNTDIDQQSAPACSLEAVPYAYDFDADIIAGINDGDEVELSRTGPVVTVRVVQRASSETG
ncbi:MAG: DUF521 domain-containing protein, partial [Anaerolineales bacterium]|nr:DUF521 domain-containing protein [Anaerolineales bacterium]